MPLQPGEKLGPYEILAPIGRGGMGEVYRAHDSRLDRDVAIKVSAAQFSERFEREAKTVAALNHSNICQVYDVGPNYLVMELIEGTPLKGPIALDQALRYAAQICDALDAAHKKNITHRDLKPANILVTVSGVKLLDFGLAKTAVASVPGGATETMALTEAGAVMGTPAYMSPEQAKGEEVDARSDIFSFGVVLYEMLSGRRAFARNSSVETMSAILHDEPAALDAPSHVSEIVRRCLRKSSNDRFQTVGDVRKALDQVNAKPAEQPSIAVLPFANMSGDKENEYFSDGLAEEIINALAHIPGLKVIARTSAFAFKGQHTDVRRIAEALGVANILEGSVRRAGNRIRVTAQLITAADGSHLWSERYDREMADVFAIQDEISLAIASALQVKLAGGPCGVHRYAPKLPAYEALLRGRHHLFKFTPESWARAKECFEQAISLDPGYAQPHADLGLGYFLAGTNGLGPLREVVPVVRAEARKALDLDPAELGPHFLLGAVAAAHDYDWEQAAGQFRVAMSATAVAANARWAYASLYLQPLARFQEAVAEMQREVEQDPLNAVWRSVLASHLTHAGLYDRAIEEVRKALDIDNNNWVAYHCMAEAYAGAGKFEEAAAAAERAHQIAPWNALGTGILAGALVRIGNKSRAAEIMRLMGDSPAPLFGRVLYHLLCSETDAAADWYERTIEQREPFALIFAAAPVNKPLRESPRWAKLAKMMNLPETAS